MSSHPSRRRTQFDSQGTLSWPAKGYHGEIVLPNFRNIYYLGEILSGELLEKQFRPTGPLKTNQHTGEIPIDEENRTRKNVGATRNPTRDLVLQKERGRGRDPSLTIGSNQTRKTTKFPPSSMITVINMEVAIIIIAWKWNRPEAD